MRKVLILAAVVVLPPRATAQPPAFSLDECATRATHVLVVDAVGQVLDVWKGDARPGDVIPLDALLEKVNPSRVDTLQYPDAYGRVPRTGRVILFLMKLPKPCPVPNPVPPDGGDVFLSQPFISWNRFLTHDNGRDGRKPDPAADIAVSAFDRLRWVQPENTPRCGWRPASPDGRVASSIAVVDDFGRVRARGTVPLFPDHPTFVLGCGNPRWDWDPHRHVPGWCAVGDLRWQVDEAVRRQHGDW